MPNTKIKNLIVIAGPTAVGKTAFSIALAEELGAEIVSADSRQFFRELNIGTAKPSTRELQQVPHHFINSHSITEDYSAGDFERDTLMKLEQLFEKADHVIMTGGSGFYIKAVLKGLDDLPAPLPGLRESLTEKLNNEGIATLQEEVRGVDPAFANTAEIQNPQRVVRALEVYHTTGVPMSQYKLNKVVKRPFREICIALDRDRTELYQRIDSRMDMMLAEGLVDEARSLAAYRSHHALQTVGYKEVYGYLDGNYSYEEMVRLLKQNSRRYAKRQLTWFRHQGDFTWFHPEDRPSIISFIEKQLNA